MTWTLISFIRNCIFSFFFWMKLFLYHSWLGFLFNWNELSITVESLSMTDGSIFKTDGSVSKTVATRKCKLLGDTWVLYETVNMSVTLCLRETCYQIYLWCFLQKVLMRHWADNTFSSSQSNFNFSTCCKRPCGLGKAYTLILLVHIFKSGLQFDPVY